MLGCRLYRSIGTPRRASLNSISLISAPGRALDVYRNAIKPEIERLGTLSFGLFRPFSSSLEPYTSDTEQDTVRTMHVSKENFDTMLPALKEAIEKADFVALDLEFSGLQAESMATILPNDTIRTRYLRMRHAVRQMQVFQFGLAIFRWDQESNSWKGMPFSFYLLPRKGKFVNCADSVRFLADNGFDFGKWATTGLPFLSRDHEQSSRKRSLKTAMCKAVRPETPAMAQRDWAEDFVKDFCKELSKWRRALEDWRQSASTAGANVHFPWEGSQTRSFENSTVDIIGQTEQPSSSAEAGNTEENQNSSIGNGKTSSADEVALSVLEDCPSLVLPNLSSIKRKFVHDVVGAGNFRSWAAEQSSLRSDLSDMDSLTDSWEDCASVTLDSDQQEQGGRFSKLRVVWLPPAEHRLRAFIKESNSPVLYNTEEMSLKDLWYAFKAILSEKSSMDRIDADVGFRKVVDIMSTESINRGLPVVGHNVMGDFMHLTDKMTKSPPPSVASEWAAEMAVTFPCIFDTKMLSGGNAIKRILVELETEALKDPAEKPPAPEGQSQQLTDGIFLKSGSFWATHKNTALDPVYQTINDTKLFHESPLYPSGRPSADVTSWADLVQVARDDTLESRMEHGRVGSSTESISEIRVAHDAGYDAWMTGCIFAKYIAAIGLSPATIRQLCAAHIKAGENDFNTLPLAGKRLFEQINNLYLMRMNPCCWKFADDGDSDAAYPLDSKKHLLPPGINPSVVQRLPSPQAVKEDDLSSISSTVHVSGLNHSIKTSDLIDMAKDAVSNWAQYCSEAEVERASYVCRTTVSRVQAFVDSLNDQAKFSKFLERSPVAWVDDDSAFLLFQKGEVAAAALAGWATQKRTALLLSKTEDITNVLPEHLTSSVKESLSSSDPEDLLNKWRGRELPLLGAFNLQSYAAFEESYPNIFAFDDGTDVHVSSNLVSVDNLIKIPANFEPGVLPEETAPSVSSATSTDGTNGGSPRKRVLTEPSMEESSATNFDSSESKRHKVVHTDSNEEEQSSSSSKCCIQ
eukprot:gb/GECG01010825.1/.p1 GENE.gb/GECG01010825.1/~~gb/GECG01010825.1/.p1  ORF type:complete len:1029 (+),score=136.17 gb/GECG01010825.1/:1-3087(+)